MRTIAIIGSTGSIGTQTLDVVRANADIRIGALAAGNNIELLEKQVREFKTGTRKCTKQRQGRCVTDCLV